jgi:hypothetical protein
MARIILSIDEQIARDEKRLNEKKARAARIKAAAGDGPSRKLARAARIMHGLERSETGDIAVDCMTIATRIDNLIGKLAEQGELPLGKEEAA